MQKIPQFNPGDTTKYPNAQGIMSIGGSDMGTKVLLYNESPYNIDLDFYNGNISTLHAWEGRYWTLDGDTKQIGWVIDSSLAVSNPPISLVMGELYGPTEKIEGTYPVALVRQIGDVTVTNNPASSLVNTGGTSGQNILSVGDNHGSTLLMSNDGLLTASLDVSGTINQYLKSANSGDLLTLGTLGKNVNVAGSFSVAQFAAIQGELQVLSDITFQNGNAMSVFGNTAGSANLWQPFKGLPFNVVMVVHVGFQNNSTNAQNIVLPQAFQNGAKIWCGGQPAVSLSSSGTAESMSLITTLVSTGGGTTAVTVLNSNSIGECNHAFDTLSYQPSQTSAHTGILLLIGS